MKKLFQAFLIGATGLVGLASVFVHPFGAVKGRSSTLAGAAAIWLIFEASRRTQNPPARDRIIQAHRFGRICLHRAVFA